MKSRGEVPQYLAGLGAGFVFLILGAAGAGAAPAYVAALALFVAVAVAFVWLAAAAIAARSANPAVATPLGAMAAGMQWRGYVRPVETPIAVSAIMLALLGGLAVLPELSLLARSQNLFMALAVVVLWAVGLTGLLLMAKAGFGVAEFVAAGAGVIALLAIAGSLVAGFIIGAVCGLGYLLAVAFGYAMHRLDRTDLLQPGQTHRLLEPGEALVETRVMEALAGVDLLRRMNDEQRREVLKIGEIQEFPPGYILGVESRESHALYCILEGEIQLSVRSPIGHLTVRIAGAGESLPLAALIGDHSLVTTAVVHSDLTALALPRSALMQLCRRRTDIGMEVYATIAEVLSARYRASLARVTQRMEQLVEEPAMWANV
ncbi:MAG: cyclic nucleotide-binding domain-containing protein [Chloroflexota bacterium]